MIVGTDHHRFDRLVSWADRFAAENPDVEVRIQYGSADPPATAEGSPMWTLPELRQIVATAHVVVSHGGPGTINAIRLGGTRPVVVPRDPALGEHVDAHQMRFVARVAATDLIDEVSDESSLHAAIRLRLSRPRGFDLQPSLDDQRVNESVQRFTEVVDALPQKRNRLFLLLRRPAR